MANQIESNRIDGWFVNDLEELEEVSVVSFGAHFAGFHIGCSRCGNDGDRRIKITSMTDTCVCVQTREEFRFDNNGW